METQEGPSVKNRVSRESIAYEARRIIAEYSSVDVDSIHEETEPYNDLGWDSLDEVEIAMEFEEEFDISVPDDFNQEIKTVGHIIDRLCTLIMEPQDE